MMKLGLMTYLMAKTWDRPTIWRVMKSTGLDGIEFRTDRQHGHGVEPELSAVERASLKAEAAVEGISISCVASGCKFHYPDPATLRENIESAKQHIVLARDLGAPMVRVFPNDLVEGEDNDITCRRVAESLLELGAFARSYGVDVVIEMHGKLGKIDTIERIMKWSEHPRVGLVFNSQPRDLVNGSLLPVWRKIRKYIRHVHVHEFSNPNFPNGDLIRLLKSEGYNGYLSLELEKSATSDANLGETILGLHKAFFNEVLRGAKGAKASGGKAKKAPKKKAKKAGKAPKKKAPKKGKKKGKK